MWQAVTTARTCHICLHQPAHLSIVLLVPHIYVLERQLRQRKSLLLLLPHELVNGLPQIKDLVLEVIAEAEGGEAGAMVARAAASQATQRSSGKRKISINAGGMS